MDDLYKGRLRAGDEYVSCLFDGANFVYVFGRMILFMLQQQIIKT